MAVGWTGSYLCPAVISGAGGSQHIETDFGAVGDGSTDDTTAYGNALTWLGGAPHRVLNFGVAKTYIINATSGPCGSLTGKSFFKMLGNGSSLKQKNGMSVYFGAFGLDLITCADAVLDSLIFDGNRANRTPAEQEGHPLALHDCDRISLLNCSFKNSAGSDGLMLSGIGTAESDPTKFTTDTLIYNCIADNNYRGGIFLRDVRGTNGTQIRGGTVSNTNGTNPEFGIGCEPNTGAAGSSNILVEGVTFTGNNGTHAYFTNGFAPCSNITVRGCYMGDTGGATWKSAAGVDCAADYMEVYSNDVENLTAATASVFNIQGFASITGIDVYNNHLNTINVGNSGFRTNLAGPGPHTIHDNVGFAITAPSGFVNNFDSSHVTATNNNGASGSPTHASPLPPSYTDLSACATTALRLRAARMM